MKHEEGWGLREGPGLSGRWWAWQGRRQRQRRRQQHLELAALPRQLWQEPCPARQQCMHHTSHLRLPSPSPCPYSCLQCTVRDLKRRACAALGVSETDYEVMDFYGMDKAVKVGDESWSMRRSMLKSLHACAHAESGMLRAEARSMLLCCISRAATARFCSLRRSVAQRALQLNEPNGCSSLPSAGQRREARAARQPCPTCRPWRCTARSWKISCTRRWPGRASWTSRRCCCGTRCGGRAAGLVCWPKAPCHCLQSCNIPLLTTRYVLQELSCAPL